MFVLHFCVWSVVFKARWGQHCPTWSRMGLREPDMSGLTGALGSAGEREQLGCSSERLERRGKTLYTLVMKRKGLQRLH